MNSPILRQSPYGPQRTIGVVAPPGAITINPGDDIQAAINAGSDGTVFWLRKGIHPIIGPNIPKSSQVFLGEFGAVLDGSGWSSSNMDDGAFKGIGFARVDVVFRNLTIRNMPQVGIETWHDDNSGWVTEYCEISGCRVGIEVCPNHLVQHCYLHHNIGIMNGTTAERGGGYGGFNCAGTRFIHNEIAYNNTEQKISQAWGIFQNNWVHHNVADGIWFDTNHDDNDQTIVEDNLCEYNGRDGISFEDTIGGVIRNNVCRHNGEGIFLHAGQQTEIYNNEILVSLEGISTFTPEPIGLSLFIDLSSSPEDGRDLQGNDIHDNVVTTTAATGLFCVNASRSGGDAGEIAAMVDNTKANNFDRNIYHVVNLSDSVWAWFGTTHNWTAWTAVPNTAVATQDVNGSHD